MKSLFTPEATAAVLAGVQGGLTIAEAAEQAGLAYATVRNWLAQGRGESGTAHAQFAAAVDAAREEAREAELTREEFDQRLARAVRNGSVQAARLWWTIHGGQNEPERPRDRLDDLKDRRAARRRASHGPNVDHVDNGNGSHHG